MASLGGAPLHADQDDCDGGDLFRVSQAADERKEAAGVLIVDGQLVYRSAMVQKGAESTKDRLQLFFLTSYSPELKPDEQVRAEVKAKGIGREAITKTSKMFCTLLRLLRSSQRTSRKIRAFFEHPETRYTLATV